MQKIIEELNGLDKVTNFLERRDWFSQYQYDFPEKLKNFTDEEKKHIDDLLIAAIRNGSSDIIPCFTYPILEQRKLIDWKNRPDVVDRIYDTLIDIGCQKEQGKQNRHYTAFVEKLVEILESYQIVDKNHKKMFDVMAAPFHHMDEPGLKINTAAIAVSLKYPWIEHPESVQAMVKLLWKLIDKYPDLTDAQWLHTHAGNLMHRMFCGQPGTTVHMSVLEDITKIFILGTDFQCDEGDGRTNTIAYFLVKGIIEEYLSNGRRPAAMLKPMMPSIKKLWECSDVLLRQRAEYIMTTNAGDTELTGGDTTDAMLDKFIKTGDSTIGIQLLKIYNDQREKIYARFPKFLEILRAPDTENQSAGDYIMNVLAQVAKTDPKRITDDIISVITTRLPKGPGVPLQSTTVQAIMIMDSLASARPAEILAAHEAPLMRSYEQNEQLTSMLGGIFEKLALDEVHQRKYLNMFVARLTSMTPGMLQMSVFYNMRKVGLLCPKILGEHRAWIEKMRAELMFKDICQSLLDVIDGRTLESVSNDVTTQQKNIVQLDTRITETESDVTTIKADVKENQKDIGTVRNDVTIQGQRLDDLKVVVDDTVGRVDELERKTLSHAPAWSRDVAKLLNPTSDSDWRLLATRLGYSPDDVRNWATQPDPCLSLLDEWFATHKTREATFAVRLTLDEINRTDASSIVERALKAVEMVISNADDEPADPPPIFLSYQWGIQPEVKLLRRHLGLSGYASWMDVGQMGGGDKLFAKIDAGIRAAKAVVCCVTSKYAESANCCKEVNLAVALGKPIIPLLVEKMTWPPPGAMGPIFGEYIFVRFFQRDGELTKDDRYWPADKFSELLFQLRFSVAPEIAAVPENSPYQNWWKPPLEVILIKPKNRGSNGLPAVEVPETISKPSTAPDIFISYQWDVQPAIKALYRRLTELGYVCWLDILQMGGGDSLFEKIDKGVRGCKVVISCVTTKYSLSANCRREVSLADSLCRPIIPLRLEPVKWPPEGPMAMVFTQKMYIDFSSSTSGQTKWDGPQFDDLIRKLSALVTK